MSHYVDIFVSESFLNRFQNVCYSYTFGVHLQFTFIHLQFYDVKKKTNNNIRFTRAIVEGICSVISDRINQYLPNLFHVRPCWCVDMSSNTNIIHKHGYNTVNNI